MILPQATAQQALTAAGELRALLRELPTGQVRASIGIASIEAGDTSGVQAIRPKADAALHQAERAGGDQAVIYTSNADH